MQMFDNDGRLSEISQSIEALSLCAHELIFAHLNFNCFYDLLPVQNLTDILFFNL
jgi:hypothetical protein